MTMADQWIEHLKASGHNIDLEKDGDNLLVNLKANGGYYTFVFNRAGKLEDIWNSWHERLKEMEDDLESVEQDKQIAEAVRLLGKVLGGRESNV